MRSASWQIQIQNKKKRGKRCQMSEIAENAPAQKPVSQKHGRRKMLIVGIVILINVGLLAFLLIQLLTPATTPSSDPIVGHSAPNFSLAALEPAAGKSTLSLSDFKGKAIVLNFWASWCTPCKEELPLLESTWKQMQAQGKNVIVIGIDYQESSSAATSFLLQNGVTYPAALDASGSVASTYGITSLPDTFFINRNGIVVSKELREITAQTLASNLKLILS
jgi:cytochrome c biogenesis protein CcmG/thiol:disulfide interchange protein DsbE